MEKVPQTLERPEYAKVTAEQMKEHVAYFEAHQDEYIEQAARAREQAISHRTERPFKVGCVVLLWLPDAAGGGRYKTFEGHNIRPHDIPVEGREKRCAERNAVETGRSAHPWPTIIGSVSVSHETNVSREVRNIDISKADDALHLCPDCRIMVRDLIKQGILREDSRVVNVNDSKKLENGNPRVVEQRSVQELLELYKDDLPP